MARAFARVIEMPARVAGESRTLWNHRSSGNLVIYAPFYY